jgi:CHAT domain-containing protein
VIRTVPVSILLVVVATGPAAFADNATTADDLGRSPDERVALHAERARAATARGDTETAATELVNTCGVALYLSYDPRTPSCVEAEAAVAPYPVLRSRFAGVQSCFNAWLLRWDAARELAAQALEHGAAGPPGDELEGEGIRLAHLCLGAVANEQGAYDEAERELAELRALSERAGDRGLTIQARTWLCRLRTLTGDHQAAAGDCAEAVALARASNDRLYVGNAYWLAGEHAMSTGDTAGAIAAWEAARDSNPLPFTLGALRVTLVGAYTRIGRLDDADRELAALDAAVRSGALPAGYMVQHDTARAAVLAARGDHAGAITVFDRAASSPMYGTVLYVLRERARSQAALGDLAAAQASLEAAVARIEAGRARAPGEDQRRTYMDRHAEIYRALAATVIARGEPGAAARALEVAEAGRARALLDAVRVAGLENDKPGPLGVAEIQAAIGPGRTLVVYVSTEDRLIAIRATAHEVAAVPLPAAGTRAELAERVAYYQALVAEVDDPAALDAAGDALYRDVLAPALAGAPGQTLLLAPDGPLHALPFDALRVDGRFLIELADIAVTPSGSLLGRGAAPTSAAGVLAVAAPVLPPEQPPLPASRFEVDALATLVTPDPTVLVGAAATKPALFAAEPAGYRVLHFATHATVDHELPLRSALALTADRGDDGRLRAAEIYRLRLGADLVVLSGCRTADGHAAPSEGPMSLARAFLHAGVGSVVATLWDVEDRQGPAFMTNLYRNLTRGRSTVAAIGDAKR